MKSVDEYVDLMGKLNLPNPKMMDVAVPANMHVGLHQDDLAKQGLALSAREGIESLGRPDILLVDLRENSERAKHGTLPGSAQKDAPTAFLELERAEDAYQHRPSRPRCQRTVSARCALSNHAVRARPNPEPPAGTGTKGR